MSGNHCEGFFLLQDYPFQILSRLEKMSWDYFSFRYPWAQNEGDMGNITVIIYILTSRWRPLESVTVKILIFEHTFLVWNSIDHIRKSFLYNLMMEVVTFHSGYGILTRSQLLALAYTQERIEKGINTRSWRSMEDTIYVYLRHKGTYV